MSIALDQTAMLTDIPPNDKPNGTTQKKESLPKLPIPKLEDSCERYLRALEGLQVREGQVAISKQAGDL